jgi:tellurite resistance protein TerC
LVYLSKGLSIILAFIGFKLFIEAFHGVGIHEIAGIHLTKPSLNVSLGVIIASLAVTTVISLAKRPKLAD